MNFEVLLRNYNSMKSMKHQGRTCGIFMLLVPLPSIFALNTCKIKRALFYLGV